MGKENIILIGTNASQTSLRGRSSNFSGRNLTERLPSSSFVWGRVMAINGKTIVYSLIDDVLGYVKTGNAIPLNPNNITVPTIGSIVPLSKGPDTNINNNAGQYSKTIYYGDPIGVQQTVNNNTNQKTLPPPPPVPSPSCPTCPPINPPKNPVNNGKLTGEYVFSKQLTTNVWSVVYGGVALVGGVSKANVYGAKYMQKEAISAGVINSKNFVFSDYTNNISSLTGELQKQYPGATINSVICFSRSGQEVWGLVGKYNFVGFMDPSTPSWVADNNNKTCENVNIRMIYNPSNWGTYPNIKKALTNVGTRMKKLNTATQTSAGHLTIPQTFYKTYISLF
jgi:hypothetical protein